MILIIFSILNLISAFVCGYLIFLSYKSFLKWNSLVASFDAVDFPSSYKAKFHVYIVYDRNDSDGGYLNDYTIIRVFDSLHDAQGFYIRNCKDYNHLEILPEDVY